MATGRPEGSEAYLAFRAQLSALGPRIRARSGCVTVFYDGADHGVPVWQQIERLQREWLTRNRVDVRYEMLSDVLRRLPSPIKRFGSLFDFATQALAKGLVTRAEDEDIWDLLSGHLARNTRDKIFVWEGSWQLRTSSVLKDIELPVLLYNRQISKLDRKLVHERMKKLAATREALSKADKELRELFESVRKRDRLLLDYGMADQLSRHWH